MSDAFGNINDMFKEGLDDFKVDPQPEVWNSIEQNLGKMEFSKFNKQTFEEVKVEPSEGLWHKIQRKLWIHNFYRFTFNQLNIYYLSAAVGVALAAVLYFSLPEEISSDQLAENQMENHSCQLL